MSNKKSTTIEAIKLHQDSHQVYMALVPTSVLLANTTVDTWDPEAEDPKENGYQRDAMQAHYSKVAKFLSKSPLLPTSILLCVRGKVDFRPYTTGSGSAGQIILPDSSLLYIVDGQHRVAGLRYAIEEMDVLSLLNYEMPVVIMAEVDKEEEVNQFFIVNSTAKKIKTDLAERLISELAANDDDVKNNLIGRGKGWMLRAVRICDMLNERENSCWYKRIQLPNAKKQPDMMIGQSGFTNTLKPILTMSWVQTMSDDKVAEMIDRYWTALKRVMPEPFSSPSDYAIQKSLGVNPWHIVAPAVLELSKDSKLSIDGIEKVFLHAKSEDEDGIFSSDFWRTGGDIAAFSSRSGFQILANRIQNILPSSDADVLDF